MVCRAREQKVVVATAAAAAAAAAAAGQGGHHKTVSMRTGVSCDERQWANTQLNAAQRRAREITQSCECVCGWVGGAASGCCCSFAPCCDQSSAAALHPSGAARGPPQPAHPAVDDHPLSTMTGSQRGEVSGCGHCLRSFRLTQGHKGTAPGGAVIDSQWQRIDRQ
jgi:hypothetical protein